MITGGRIENNAAARAGGGIENKGGAATLTNITLDDNTTGLNGGGLHISGAGGINSAAGTTTLANSIVAHKPSSGADCSGVTANGAHLDSDGSCQATIMADPMLGPLQSNGGTTPIHELLTDSPAINAGDNAICAATPINNVAQQCRSMGPMWHLDLGFTALGEFIQKKHAPVRHANLTGARPAPAAHQPSVADGMVRGAKGTCAHQWLAHR